MTSVRRITPVVLCGGSGTRLWPRSRADKPKPFLPLVGDRSLFRQTLLRCEGELFDAPVIVTGERLVGHVTGELDAAPCARLIVEPEAKNTAAAIALAACRLPSDSVMLVCPSDHYMGDKDAFIRSVEAAAGLATEGWLVSLALKARRPETGFGYLRRGPAIGARGFEVAEFVEKPDLERARAFVASGEYLWNGGIFAFQVKQFLSELARLRPALAEAVRASVEDGALEGSCFRPDPAAFAGIAAESVDCAVMENTDRAAMVIGAFDWSDIGNWPAVREARQRDDRGNCVQGPVELLDCRNVLVDSDGPNVHVVGLDGVIVIVDGNDVVVTSVEGAPKVAQLSGARRQ